MGRDWLAFGVAAYGAVVATSVAAYQFIRDRPGVKLVLVPVTVTDDIKTGSYDGTPPRYRTRNFWAIRVVNHRKRPITIREGGLLGDRGQQIHSKIVNPDTGAEDTPFPFTLTDGTSLEFWAPLDLIRDRDRCGAWVVDDLGRYYELLEPSGFRRRWHNFRERRRFEKAITAPRGDQGQAPKPASQR